MSIATARRPGFSPSDEAAAQSAARAIVNALHASLRAVRLYPIENAAVRTAISELEQLAAQAIRNGQCSVRTVGDYLFVNDVRLRLQLDNYAAVSNVMVRLQQAGVGELRVRAVADSRAWMVLLAQLTEAGGDAAPAERVAVVTDRLHAAGIECFDLDVLVDDDAADIADEDSQERARQTYMRSLNATRDLLTATRLGRSPAMRRVKRAVQGIVDVIMSDPSSLVGLTALREFDEYTFVHSVNVCILSVALGRRIGLNKVQLLDLGIAALMHDIGKSRLPSALLNKQGALRDEEFEELKSHTWRGTLLLAQTPGSASRSWRAMNVAYEHHMRVDGTGYPQPVRARTQSLFSRIVAIADGFDAATSTRSYQPTPWTPADVVRGMRENASLGFDPVIVKAFINLTGIYPVGTLVALDTLEIALVVAANPDAQMLARPLVRLLFDSMGNRVGDTSVVDLAQRDSSGAYSRTIIRTEDPDRHGVRIADYLG